MYLHLGFRLRLRVYTQNQHVSPWHLLYEQHELTTRRTGSKHRVAGSCKDSTEKMSHYSESQFRAINMICSSACPVYAGKLCSLTCMYHKNCSQQQNESETYRWGRHHGPIPPTFPVRGIRAVSRHHRALPHVDLAMLLLREHSRSSGSGMQPQVSAHIAIDSDAASQQQSGRVDAPSAGNHNWRLENTLHSVFATAEIGNHSLCLLLSRRCSVLSMV